MLIGVVTDTHDNGPMIERAIDLFNGEEVELVVHAGDMIAPFSAQLFKRLDAPLKFHLGNNDGEILFLRQRLLEIGAEFHKYDFQFDAAGSTVLVQHEPQNLEAIAASGALDVIIYGHTHDPDLRRVDQTLVLNPGECCQWLRGLANVALLDTATMDAEIVDLL